MQATSQRIDAQTLLDWMGYKHQGPCKRALEKQGVKVFEGRNGIWTTLELVNAAGIGKTAENQPDEEAQEWL